MQHQKEYICIVCSHAHSEELEGKWDELPEDFTCPECGAGKEDYELV
jgi:rubredoxin